MIIIDVIMPRMNGRELYREISRLKPGMEVIFSSGYTADALPEDLEGLNGLSLLSKTYVPGKLLSKVRTVLDEKS